MKRIRFSAAIVFFCGILSLTSCRKWLDAPAPLQVDGDELFSTQQGFKDVLNGVYLKMGDRTLYGMDLTFGLNSVISRNYDVGISQALGEAYYSGAAYDFQNDALKRTCSTVWEQMYGAIANLNNLLENVDSRRAVFTGDQYNSVKGEALGLRAYLYFELVRMFAPVPDAVGLNSKVLPYYNKITPVGTQPVTTIAVIDSCLADLTRTVKLMDKGTPDAAHFNYWAAKGLMARIYQYKGDLQSAGREADEVIQSGIIALATDNKDPMYTQEHLFSLYSYAPYALAYYKSLFNTKAPVGVSTQTQTAIFVTGSGATSDWRRAFVDPASGIAFGNTISPKKFYGTTSNVLPLIRVSEMYYIAAERAVSAGDLQQATALLDSIRVHRNLKLYTESALSSDSLEVEIFKEYRKEFIGEGQLFYYFKRKNMSFDRLPDPVVPVSGGASYQFVRPE